MRACLIRSTIRQVAGLDYPGPRPAFYRHDWSASVDPPQSCPATPRDPSAQPPPPLNECERRFKSATHPDASCGHPDCPFADEKYPNGP